MPAWLAIHGAPSRELRVQKLSGMRDIGEIKSKEIMMQYIEGGGYGVGVMDCSHGSGWSI